MKHQVYAIFDNFDLLVYVGKHSCRGVECPHNPTGAEVCNYKGSGRYLKRVYKKHGRASFRKEILKVCSSEAEALLNEEYLIRAFKDKGLCKYNLELGGDAWGLGRIITEETRARMSASHKGKVVSAETRAKLSAAMKGKPSYIRTKESKAKTSKSLKGRTRSPEWGLKMRQVTGRGYVIKGVEYLSYSHAAENMKESLATIRRRVLSDNHPEWRKK